MNNDDDIIGLRVTTSAATTTIQNGLRVRGEVIAADTRDVVIRTEDGGLYMALRGDCAPDAIEVGATVRLRPEGKVANGDGLRAHHVGTFTVIGADEADVALKMDSNGYVYVASITDVEAAG